MILYNTSKAINDIKVLDVIQHYLKLKKNGDRYTCLCPFHDENTASFHVSPEKNIFKCFGCGKSGDAVQFVMEFEKKGFPEAIEIIAGITGAAIELHKDAKNVRRKQARLNNNAVKTQPFDFIPLSHLNYSSTGVTTNGLTAKIASLVSEDVMLEVLGEYHININGNYLNYPQIDYNGNLRTSKAILYKGEHRTNSITWLHSELKKQGKLPDNFRLKQCLTGEHLLSKDKDKPVAIVEGQSTMIFMAALAAASIKYHIKQFSCFSDFIWLSTGGADGINWCDEHILKALKGRNVYMFPDAGFYDKWFQHAEEMRRCGICVDVSRLLEEKFKVGQLAYNNDLRDFLMYYAVDINSLCRHEPLRLQTTHITALLGETKTGRDFSNIIIQGFKTRSGYVYDVLFDEQGEPIAPGEKSDAVKALAVYFKKDLQPGTIDELPCWIHPDKRFIVNNN
jgi:hypothetical protein